VYNLLKDATVEKGDRSMCKILVISPYDGLKNLILEVNKELKKDMDVYVGNLYDGLAIAKSLDHRNYDVIISRGATAKLLQRHLSIPVMEIQLTGYDILRTLTLLQGFSGKIGMMSYLNTIPGANAIGKLLNMNITFYPIHTEAEIKGQIKRASEEGVQIIIGDVISTNTAANFGIQGILITSGKEAIIETITNVENLVYYIEKEKNRLSKIRTTFEFINEGVLFFDEYETCIYVNEKAKKQFPLINETELLTVQKLVEMEPRLTKLFENKETEGTTHIEVEMNDKMFRWTYVSFADDDVDGFALLLKVEKKKEVVAQQETIAYFHFNSLVATSEKMKELLNVAKRISTSELPILIYGEPGAGKESIAQAIHNNSTCHEGPYVFVNCEAYSETQLESELFGYGNKQIGAIERATGGTLFIDAIGAMPYSLQGKLLQVVTTNQVHRQHSNEKTPVNVRLIVAHRHSIETLVQEGKFREDLYHELHGYLLHVPPLRERMEDIDDLVRIIIASSHVSLGKQISGMRPTVLKELKRLSWPGNIQQLKHVVEKMCFMSRGPFIEYDEVKSVLKKLQAENEEEEKNNTLLIGNKTLQEIEEEVIKSVLIQEDYNQSKVAERLGINRSTLWRKMKELN